MDDHDLQFTDYADFTGEEDSIPPSPTNDQPSSSPTFASLEIEPRYEYHDDADPFHEDTPMLAQDSGYNSSGSSTKHSGDILRGDLDDDLDPMSSRASSRSSVSSIPGSVLTNMADGIKSTGIQDHMLSDHWEDHGSGVHGSAEGQLRSFPAIRQRESIFRKPSSVKAMQMHTEDEGDEDFLTPPKRRSGRFSDVSMRSTGSSPLRKTQFYSPSGSSSKQKVKKEYPLVLLHCNLLPPSLPVPTAMGYLNQKILKEVLPSEYWRRWKLLEEKIGSGVLRERGVLISHPEDLYDLLEERLLESLELQRPRLDHGHFLGRDETDCEIEEGLCLREESATDEEEGEECADCGGRVVRHNNAGRKWEIKVFAANGLMRAGAWAAAWKEMEKVDVEVSLWLPSEIRRELEKRLLEEEMHHFGARLENRLPVPQLQGPETEMVHMAVEPHRHSLQAHTPTPTNDTQLLFVPEQLEGERESKRRSPVSERRPTEDRRPLKPIYVSRSSEDIDLRTLLVNYVRVLASDRRNFAIAVLGILVLFLAVHSGPQTNQSALRPFPQDILDSVSVSSSSVSLMQPSSTSWNTPTSCVLSSAETLDVSDMLPTPSVSSVASPMVDLKEEVPPRAEMHDFPKTLGMSSSEESLLPVAESPKMPSVSSVTSPIIDLKKEEPPRTEMHDSPKTPSVSSSEEGLLPAVESPKTISTSTALQVRGNTDMEVSMDRSVLLVEQMSPASQIPIGTGDDEGRMNDLHEI
ncbi:hypothetical protein BO71DRAFT_374732 [Aspergillus ellipticus CBS 707.79]|uniref:Flavoprotein oxygenase n=1 Tax=Aspergillus ellipticus CBS 707.79 TaxID=1448320 RepID=A0A319DI98_9EURO|nr:hypothetical protein BO71DRAFT_374732 [Aspergillus ellipticus CBS 707.79]